MSDEIIELGGVVINGSGESVTWRFGRRGQMGQQVFAQILPGLVPGLAPALTRPITGLDPEQARRAADALTRWDRLVADVQRLPVAVQNEIRALTFWIDLQRRMEDEEGIRACVTRQVCTSKTIRRIPKVEEGLNELEPIVRAQVRATEGTVSKEDLEKTEAALRKAEAEVQEARDETLKTILIVGAGVGGLIGLGLIISALGK